MRVILAFVLTLSMGVTALAEDRADSGLKKVWVAPFTESGSLVRPGWLSYRLNQSISEELTKLKNIELVAGRDATISSATPAPVLLATARGAGADLLVTGSIKTQGSELAALGDIIETQTGRSIGTFKSTGATRDLFAVEDSAARQISLIVTAAVEKPQAVAGLPTTAPTNTSPLSTAGARFQTSDLAQSLNDPKSFTQYARDTTPRRSYPTDLDYSYGAYAPYSYYPSGSYGSYPLGYSPYGYWGGWSGWDFGFPGTIIIQQNIGSDRHRHTSGSHSIITPGPRQPPLTITSNPPSMIPNPPSLIPNPPSLIPNPPSNVPHPPPNVMQPHR